MSDNLKIYDALHIAYQYGQVDGAHHKAWVIDQMVRALLKEEYEPWLEEYQCVDEDGDYQYEWDKGIAP